VCGHKGDNVGLLSLESYNNFLMKQEGSPYWIYCKIIKVFMYNSPETNEKRKIEKRHYEIFSSHCDICWARWEVVLCISRANSDLKTTLQCSTLESSSLKIQAFLSFQIHQRIMIIISMVKGKPMWHFIYVVALVALNQDGIITPIEAQQFLAKGHDRNKCLKVSSLCNRHSSHV
jgi:hypothetical protein